VHNKAVNADAQVRPAATRRPVLGRRLLLRYASRSVALVAALGMARVAGATSAVVPPSIESRVCAASHVFVGRVKPETYRQRQTCDPDSVSYFYAELCYEAVVDVEIEAFLRPEGESHLASASMAYLPRLAAGLVGVATSYVFLASKEDSASGATYRMRDQNRRLLPLSLSELPEVRSALANCR
jgi:hypothetical protein